MTYAKTQGFFVEKDDLERDRDILLWWDWSINKLVSRTSANRNSSSCDRSSEDDKKLSET